MSAEILRRAASLMREHQHAAAGLWAGTAEIIDRQPGRSGPAAFVRSWHPAVALAVADWLDREAALHETISATADLLSAASAGLGTGEIRLQFTDTGDGMAASTMPQALAVALAYLGESQ